MNKEGIQVFSPAEVYFANKTDSELTICAPTQKINRRGDTLGGPNLTIRISSPAPEVFRIRTNHYMGVRKRTPDFELEIDENRKLIIEEQDNYLKVASGSFHIEIDKTDWKMTFYREGEKLTQSGQQALAYINTDWKGLAYEDGEMQNAYMRECLSLSVGELIYGYGERFTPFVKNGQTIEIWNQDGGTSTEQAYKNIPFYISNRGYGVFVNHPEKVSFEVSSEQVKKVQFSVPGEELDYFIFNGPTMKEVLSRYTDMTGKPGLPPAWTFGLWLSTSFTTKYDEVTVNSFVDGMLKRGIGLKVFHFDCFWMKDFHWCDFTWDSRVFPDPAGMLKRLKAKGLKICVWINSYIAQESPLFKEGVEGGYFLKRPNGNVWQWDLWQPGMGIVDFTDMKPNRFFH
jgi:alpha-D-xyloside xylohydrolase